MVKNPPANAGDIRDVNLISGSGRAPGGGRGHLLHYLPGESLWTEEAGGLQSIGWQRVRHDWSNLARIHPANTFMLWWEERFWWGSVHPFSCSLLCYYRTSVICHAEEKVHRKFTLRISVLDEPSSLGAGKRIQSQGHRAGGQLWPRATPPLSSRHLQMTLDHSLRSQNNET